MSTWYLRDAEGRILAEATIVARSDGTSRRLRFIQYVQEVEIPPESAKQLAELAAQVGAGVEG